jgi:predicted solute-binding protein
MVFGVFAARKDSDILKVKEAFTALSERLKSFESDTIVRDEVIRISSEKSSQSIERLERYFGEVINRFDPEDMMGLRLFLKDACGMSDEPQMAW